MLLAGLWVLLAASSYVLLAIPRGQRFDFYPRWVGARAALAGESPYSEEVTWRIQEGMFGRRLEPWEDQQRFAYPAYVAWTLLPLWLLPFPVSVSLWCGLQLLLLLVLPVFVATLLRWRPRPLRLAVLLFFSVLLYRYPINAYVLGQFVIFSLACLVAAWWGLERDRPGLAVLALLGATARPALAVFPLLILLLVAWRRGRMGVVWGWAAGLASLWLLTRMWSGPWVGDFLAGLRGYAEYSFPRWPPLAAGSLWLAVPIAAGALAWGVWMGLRSHSLPASTRVPWLLSVALVVALIVLPQTNNYTLVLGLLPAWVVLWASEGRWGVWAAVLVVLASPWAFHVAGGRLPVGLEQLVIPAALGSLLSLGWHVWRGGGEAG